LQHVPANLNPEYFKAEKWYSSATTTEEKILALEQMLSVMPKHKGTDHLKADIRRKLSSLRESATRKKAGKGVDLFHVPRSGAGQISLIGTPNCGKSSIVASLTNAKVTVADFPYATGLPVPGMVTFEDVQIELVDLPPITEEFVTPGQVGTYRNCDVISIVIDLSDNPAQQMEIILDFLDSRNLLVSEQTPTADEDGNLLGKRAFVICTKADLAEPAAFEQFKNSCNRDFEFIKVSTETGEGLNYLPRFLFDQLKIIRVYAKPPGEQPDMNEPFTLPQGATVMDLASTIHRELAEKLKFARIWGTGVYDGQNTQRTHVLNDKDIIELHFS
jgi:ribosome-interacting GTPase 1